MKKFLTTLLLLSFLLGCINAYSQQVILAGPDLWSTPGGGQTTHSFADTPLPAGFFGEGSAAFDGTVVLEGLPFLDNPALMPQGTNDLGNTDTIVQRLEDMSLPTGPDDMTTTPIEIVALSLRSVEPIEVSFNGNASGSLFDMEVQITLDEPQPQGQMTIRGDNTGGGTFDATLPVHVDFFFVNKDTGAFVGGVKREIHLAAKNQPWQPTPPTFEGNSQLVEIKTPVLLGPVAQVNVPLTSPNFFVGIAINPNTQQSKCALTNFGVHGTARSMLPAFTSSGLDTDGDSIPNVCDNCQATPNPRQIDQNFNCIGDVCDPLSQQPIITRIASEDFAASAGAVFAQARNNPDKAYLLELNYLFPDPLNDPEPILLENGQSLSGNLQIIGLSDGAPCPPGVCRIQHPPDFTGNSFEIEGNSDVGFRHFEVDANPGGSFIKVHPGAQLDFLDMLVRGEGNATIIDNMGGTVNLGHSTIQAGCAQGGSWAVGQSSGTISCLNSVLIPSAGCATDGFDIPDGILNFNGCFAGPETNCTGECNTFNSLHTWGNESPIQLTSVATDSDVASKGNSLESQCNDFGSGAFNSLGYNIDIDGSCFLDHATDLPNTDPLVVVDANGIPQPQPGSPVIESGPVDFVNNELPCIYKDLNGLGRPQDFDLDGVFTCDRGPVEVQGGPDIGAPQSAAFYDIDRNGEGAFVEILPDGRAVVSFYTYTLDGNGLVWLIGLGRVVGNSVVVDEMQRVSGGVFGANFDPDNIIRIPVGGLSLVFPDCDAIANPGRLNFTAMESSGLENLLHKANRLTSIVDCDGSTPAANAHRSGAFYAPDRSGEGIFVQWLSDGRVVFVFYTFDTEGNAFWVINDAGKTTINGNTVTASMVYAEGKTRFGANFNPAEVILAAWGTITLTYTDDDNLTFDYDSSLAGFGVGTHAYTRLTNLAGTQTVAQND